MSERDWNAVAQRVLDEQPQDDYAHSHIVIAAASEGGPVRVRGTAEWTERAARDVVRRAARRRQ